MATTGANPDVWSHAGSSAAGALGSAVLKPPLRSDEFSWLLQLSEAVSPRSVARLAESLSRVWTDADQAVLLWRDGERLVCGTDADMLDVAQLGDAAEFLIGPRLVQAASGHLMLRVASSAVLLLYAPDGRAPRVADGFVDFLPLIGAHLQRVLKLASLQSAHQQLQRSEVLQRALFAISDLSGSTLDMAEMLERIHGIVRTLMYAENFYIVRHDPDRQTMRFIYFSDLLDTENLLGADIPMSVRADTLTWHVLVDGKALMGGMEQIRTQLQGQLSEAGPECHDWLGVPVLRDGKARGALVVQSYEEGIRYTDDDRALLEFVGTHIFTALERKESKDELEAQVRLRTLELAEANRGLQQEVFERERAERLQASLFHIAQLATVDIDEAEFYKRMHLAVGELINAENFFIGLLSEDRQILNFPYYVDGGLQRQVSRDIGRGLSEYVMRTGRALLGCRADIDRLGLLGEVDLSRIGRPSLCWLGVPLRVGEDIIGLVVVQSYAEEFAYGPADRDLLGFVALQIAASIHRRRAAVALQSANVDLEHRVHERTRELREQIAKREAMQKQLEHQVMHDALTGLPNRRLLRDRLEIALQRARRERHSSGALLYLDVDRFKVINDSLGHLAGDCFLKEIANRLRDCVRLPDMAARISGDEFALFLDEAGSVEGAAAFAARALDSLNRVMHVAGRELEPSISIGIAMVNVSYQTPDDLLRAADMALYRAKEMGRNRYVVFDDRLSSTMLDVLALEAELRRGLQRHEFIPYFQSVRQIETGEVVGHEALLRWNHPTRGILEPAQFVKVAQDCGLIEAIDWQLFESACRTMANVAGETFVTINVSALHLRQEDFDEHLLEMLARSGLTPSRLIIEVTEGSLLDDPTAVHAILERLRVSGIGAALDDFGTGYSSLSYLHSLPLRMVKIDRSFVSSLDENLIAARPVVGAILALAKALGIEVIAEGIETQQQCVALRAMGCGLGQGYLFGLPAPAAS